MQFETKTIYAFQIVKTDGELADLVSRMETNVANFGTLSTKAQQQLVKLHEKGDSSAKKVTLTTMYERLATLAKKMTMCWQTQ